MSAHKVTFCANCNATQDENGGQQVVTITFTDPAGEAYGRQNFRRILCWDCANCVSGLDFAEFIRRHETRRRVLELP